MVKIPKLEINKKKYDSLSKIYKNYKSNKFKNIKSLSRKEQAIIYFQIGLFEDYNKLYDKSLINYKKSYNLMKSFGSSYNLGDLYFHNNNYKLALKFFIDALYFGVNNPSVYFMIAKTYYKLNNNELCEKYLIKASNLSDFDSMFILVKYYYCVKRYNDISKYIDKLINSGIYFYKNNGTIIKILVLCQEKNFIEANKLLENLDNFYVNPTKKIIKSFMGQYFDFNE